MRQLKFIALLFASTVVVYFAVMLLLAYVPYKSRPLALITNSYYTWKGGGTYTKFREFDRNGHYNVVVLGSSRAYRGYDPQIFADSGYTMFNLGTSAQSIRNTYFIAKNYITKENTGLLIIDIFSGSFRPMQLESSADLIQNLDDRTAATDIAWHTNDIRCLNMFMLRTLTENDAPYFADPDYAINGYARKADSLSPKLRKYIEVFEQPDSVTLNVGATELEYYSKLVALCKDRGIKLVWVYSPVSAFYSRVNHEAFMEMVKPLKGDNYFYDHLNAGLSSTDCFYDDTHLNAAGVARFNAKLIADLKRDGLLDRGAKPN